MLENVVFQTLKPYSLLISRCVFEFIVFSQKFMTGLLYDLFKQIILYFLLMVIVLVSDITRRFGVLKVSQLIPY